MSAKGTVVMEKDCDLINLSPGFTPIWDWTYNLFVTAQNPEQLAY